MQPVPSPTEQSLNAMAIRLRIDCIQATTAANWGSPASCASIAEIMSVMFFHPAGMNCFPNDMKNPANDKVILSKGHAAPILYSCWMEAGMLSRDNLMEYSKPGSNLEGTPSPKADFVDVPTGEPGVGLSAACGMAMAMKNGQNKTSKVFCIVSDGEMQEGSCWEALNFASSYRLNNMIIVVDYNNFQISGPTSYKNSQDLANRFTAFGCNTIIIDGHNISEVIDAFNRARASDKPFAIIAKTVLGKDFPGIENKPEYIERPLGAKATDVINFLQAKLPQIDSRMRINEPRKTSTIQSMRMPEVTRCPAYPMGSKIDMHEGAIDCLLTMNLTNPNVTIMSADTECLQTNPKIKACPDKVMECYLSDQNMIGAAMGMTARGKIPCCMKTAAFLNRAHGMMRNAAIYDMNVKTIGCCSGVTIGRGGPVMMSLDDMAFARSIPNCRVLYPCDATSAYKATELACRNPGNFYVRLAPKYPLPVIYSETTEFNVGKCQVLRNCEEDVCTIICGGVTVKEALIAYDKFNAEGKKVCVIDLFSIKPIDSATINELAAKTRRVLIVEDHNEHGGMCDAVCEVLHGCGEIRICHLFVNEQPVPADDDMILARNGIDADAIVRKVKEMLNS
mmetsp:Transcript_1031/g.2523  ORF Transcript_1031/g.2523 Transcript_1031/m.2523 type:complete len:621 (-) Transcript_1031:6996-8858(-)